MQYQILHDSSLALKETYITVFLCAQPVTESHLVQTEGLKFTQVLRFQSRPCLKAEISADIMEGF